LKVSIIIPIYNTEKYVKQCVDSCLSQTFPGYEIIVVDDGSTDSTPDILKGYGSVIKVITKQKGGTASALNEGIKQSKGEWIKWISADDALLYDSIEVLMKRATGLPDSKNCIIYTDYFYINEHGIITGEFIQRNYNDSTQEERNKMLLHWFYGRGSSSLMHRSIFDKVGYYDESLTSLVDYEFWIRACLVYDIRMYLVQHKTLLFRMHSEQLAKKFGGISETAIKSKIVKMLPPEKKAIYGLQC